MKIYDIAKNIDKSKNNESWVDTYILGEDLNLPLETVEQTRIKSYWVGNWYCTDSYVGYKIYFLDDEPIIFSIQRGRKCDEELSWFSKDLAIKTKEYLATLIIQEDDELSVDFCDVNEDIGDGYKINYNNQILDYKGATFNGKSVEIIERIKDVPNIGIDSKLKVKIENEESILDVKDLKFKYHLN